jgi:hypothetical protein
MGVETSIDIAATPERVWEVLTDFERWEAWNPFIPHVEGAAETGTALRLSIVLGGRRLPVDARVRIVDPPEHLRWRGPRLELLGRVFSGEHYFRLEARDGGTRLTHGEDFDGLIAPLVSRWLEPVLRKSFGAMNEALKRRAERSD